MDVQIVDDRLFTRWYDVVDAGFVLHTELVLRPARQRSVIQFGDWHKFGHAATTLDGVVLARQIRHAGRVVELPHEAQLAGIRLDLAGYHRRFHPTHAVRRLLAGSADGRICQMRNGQPIIPYVLTSYYTL